MIMDWDKFVASLFKQADELGNRRDGVFKQMYQYSITNGRDTSDYRSMEMLNHTFWVIQFILQDIGIAVQAACEGGKDE